MSVPSLKSRMKALIAVSASLVLVAALAVALLLNSRDYEHFTREAEPEIAPVPQQVSGVAWEWEAAEGTVVQEVAPGPAGPILLTGHGAIGLDGNTGEEIWGITTSDTDTFDTLAGVTPAATRRSYSRSAALTTARSTRSRSLTPPPGT